MKNFFAAAALAALLLAAPTVASAQTCGQTIEDASAIFDAGFGTIEGESAKSYADAAFLLATGRTIDPDVLARVEYVAFGKAADGLSNVYSVGFFDVDRCVIMAGSLGDDEAAIAAGMAGVDLPF